MSRYHRASEQNQQDIHQYSVVEVYTEVRRAGNQPVGERARASDIEDPLQARLLVFAVVGVVVREVLSRRRRSRRDEWDHQSRGGCKRRYYSGLPWLSVLYIYIFLFI